MKFSAVTRLYPTATLIRVEQYFLRNKWHTVIPAAVAEVLANDNSITALVENLLRQGATKISLLVQCQQTKTNYSVFLRAEELRNESSKPLVLKQAGLRKRATELTRKESLLTLKETKLSQKKVELKQIEAQIKKKEKMLVKKEEMLEQQQASFGSVRLNAEPVQKRPYGKDWFCCTSHPHKLSV
jgi:hypothetical protein